MTRKFVAKMIRSVGKRCFRLADVLHSGPPPRAQSVHESLVRQWRLDNAEKTLRYEYDLTENDVVFDVGGFEGDWAAEIAARYTCKVHVFEPVPDFADQIRERFHRNRRVAVHAFGLAGATRMAKFAVAGDGSSALRDSRASVQAQLVDVVDFLDGQRLGEVALAKINIEGGEYELLERLLAAGLTGIFREVQVQFHDFFPEAKPRMERIQQQLSQTHHLTYQYAFVWENWRRRGACKILGSAA